MPVTTRFAMKRKQVYLEPMESLKRQNPKAFRGDNFVINANSEHKLYVEAIFSLIADILTPQNNDYVSIIRVCKFWYNNRTYFSQKALWSLKAQNIHFLSELKLKPTSMFIIDEMKPQYLASLVELNLQTLGLIDISWLDPSRLTSVNCFISLGGGFSIKIPPNTERLHTNAYRYSGSQHLKHIVHENMTLGNNVTPDHVSHPNLEIFESQNFCALPNLIDCGKLTSLAIGTESSFVGLDFEEFKNVLPHLVNLERLFIHDLEDLHLLSKMKNLKLFQCRNGKFKSLTPLSTLPNLEVLEIPQCRGVCSLDGLQHLKHLRVLNIDFIKCEVSSSLALCTSIQHLSVVDTRLFEDYFTFGPFDFTCMTNLKAVRTDYASDIFPTFCSKAPPATVFYNTKPYLMLVPWAFFDQRK